MFWCVYLFKLKEKDGYGFDIFHCRYWSKINQLPTFSKSKGMGKKLLKLNKMYIFPAR